MSTLIDVTNRVLQEEVSVKIDTFFQVVVIITGWLQCAYYLNQRYGRSDGRQEADWEVIYVAFVEPVCYLITILAGQSASIKIKDPVLDQSKWQQVDWIRYAGWMATCPVILIHLSKLMEFKYTNKCF